MKFLKESDDHVTLSDEVVQALAERIADRLLDGGKRLVIVETLRDSEQAFGLRGWSKGPIVDQVSKVLKEIRVRG